MIEPPKKSSVLFDRIALWGVLALLVGAIIFRNLPLVMVSTFLFLVSVIILIWKKNSLKNLLPSVNLKKTRIFADNEVLLTFAIKNNKWLPLVWLEWESPAHEGLVWTGLGEKHHYRVRLLWLMAYQQVTWELPVRALRRGVYPLGQLTLRSGDAFRFSEIEQEVDLNKELYVYPKSVAVDTPPLHNLFQWGQGQKGGVLEDSSQVIGIREYQRGDELRKLNWQATARTGKLQTWVYKPLVPKELLIYVDVEDFYSPELLPHQQEDFERFLSIVSSVVLAYHKQNINIGLITNASDHSGNQIPSLAPTRVITPFLDSLAKIKLQEQEQSGLFTETMTSKGRTVSQVFYFGNSINKKHVDWVGKNRVKSSNMIFYYYYQSKFSSLLPKQAFSIEKLVKASYGREGCC